MKLTTKSLTRAAMIAAIYCVLTVLLQPISYGAIQFRVSEALTLLPILTVDAIPGLAVGCLLANLLGGAVWFDVVFGTLATLLAAICTRLVRKSAPLGAAMPVLFNGAIVGPVVYFGYVRAPGTPIIWAELWTTVATVALGEAVVCFILGLVLIAALKKTPETLWHD
ncbi:MAG: QueT transporter family protein [Clostridia bacterium]|nr:QueT transporter family protein [Clostridia bacterium]MBQ8971980.1 QueT transporter family protein [Clostridia bacterium]